MSEAELTDQNRERLLRQLKNLYPYGIPQKYFQECAEESMLSEESSVSPYVILVQDLNSEFEESQAGQLLLKIIKNALNCKKSEVLISSDWGDIKFAKKLVIAFGDISPEIKSKNFPMNSVQSIQETTVLFTEELSTLDRDPVKKKDFWLALKQYV